MSDGITDAYRCGQCGESPCGCDKPSSEELGFLSLAETKRRLEYIIGTGKIKQPETEMLLLSCSHHLEKVKE